MSTEKKQSIRDAYSNYMKSLKEGGTGAREEEELLSCLMRYKDAWIEERKKTKDRTWRQTAAFYSGNHYVRDPGGPGSTYRVRVRENHSNNIMTRLQSIIIQNMPITRVFPNSSNHEDAQNAETTELYGKYFWRTKKLEKKFARFVKYALCYGNGFMFRQYDPDLGGKIVLNESETQSGDSEVTEYHGDIRLEVDDPFKIAVRPGIDEFDDMYDFIRTVPVNRSEVEAKYGKIEAEPAKGLNLYNGETKTDDELVMMNHYYHKPMPWFEEGMYACWVGKKLLKIRPASECEKDLPLIHLPFDKALSGFYGISSIEQVMDLQEQLNRAASQIIEARNLMARPRVLASHEAQIPAQALSDRPGEIIRFKLAGGPPKFEVPSFNFREFAEHKGDLRNAMSQVSGITTASRGEIPNAARTALALQLVLEQDRSQYLPFIKEFHQSIIDVMYGIFSTAAEYFDEEDPRVIKIEGPIVTTRTFHGGIVPSPIDIYLEDTNPLGWTAAGRIEQVTNLVQSGLIKDESKALEMLKLSSADPAFEFSTITRQAALKEIELLNKGERVLIGDEDDDGIHLDEHTKIEASYNFRNLPPAVQAVHKDHIAQHKARRAAAMGGGQPQPGATPPMPQPGGPQPGPQGAQPQMPPRPGMPAHGAPHPALEKGHAVGAQEMMQQLSAPTPNQMDQLLSKPR